MSYLVNILTRSLVMPSKKMEQTHCRAETTLNASNALIPSRLDKNVYGIIVDFLYASLCKFSLQL